jgi:hypothetical protein
VEEGVVDLAAELKVDVDAAVAITPFAADADAASLVCCRYATCVSL